MTALERSKEIPPVTTRLVVLTAIALTTAACGKKEGLVGGEFYAVRTSCPQVGIPAGTGDITLFDPAGRTDAAAIDVSATMTNLRATCDEATAQISSTATFDVVATRRDPTQARQVVLPFYNVVMRGGNAVVAKKVGAVALNFAAGSYRAQTNSRVVATVDRSAAYLPQDVRDALTRKRKVGDTDAAIDPMSDPKIRDAVARSTFEHLVGFQLTQDQLRYNVTR
jgi:hypothetical protein